MREIEDEEYGIVRKYPSREQRREIFYSCSPEHMKCLSDREQFILHCRLNPALRRPIPYPEIGEKIGLSRTRTAQLEIRATYMLLRRMKQACGRASFRQEDLRKPGDKRCRARNGMYWCVFKRGHAGSHRYY
jgi:DNA-directed RNA polymerase sigma subunit (sigma70/sigma32)